jgi:7,8-dihydroneopterin aldolase/epimerase/oxygenase
MLWLMSDVFRQFVRLHGVSSYAYHGCMAEEAVVGTEFITDVTIAYDFTHAAREDNLSLTADYVLISAIIHEEMAVRSNLIEQVLMRIVRRIEGLYPNHLGLRVEVRKKNPPAGYQVPEVSVVFDCL